MEDSHSKWSSFSGRRHLIGEGDRLLPRDAKERPWLAARDFARLARSPFPGNIRTIVNVTHQLAIASRGQPFAVLDGAIESILGSVELASAPRPRKQRDRER